MIFKSILKGLIGIFALLAVYFGFLSFLSGWDYTKSQFGNFWYYILPLSLGFGIQITLYSYLKSKIKEKSAGKVLAVSGTVSTAAMISCCAHYLVNILPFIAAAGVVSFIANYQIQFFWVGIFFNLAGIIFIINKIRKIL